MPGTIKVSELEEFDPAAYLSDDVAVAAYLTEIAKENNFGLLASALGDVARAHGMSDVAKRAGIAREALYKALRADSSPRFETISKVVGALGMRIVVEPIAGRGAAATDSLVAAVPVKKRARARPRSNSATADVGGTEPALA